MLADRRLLHSRHELRFGTREVVLGGVAVVVIWALTFLFGILVGRELVSPPAGSARGGPAAAPTALAGTGPGKKAERAPSEERLTFYQTLTAPTADLPAPAAPTVEERLVPREPPAAAGPTGAALPERRPAAPPPAGRAAARARKEAPAPAPAAAPAPVPAAPAAVAAEGRLWTVQVSSFRSRALADELLARLAAKGFDAYLVSVTTEEGRVRHRVRVGEYVSRAEAERVATELKGERNLSPFVTTRTR